MDEARPEDRAGAPSIKSGFSGRWHTLLGSIRRIADAPRTRVLAPAIALVALAVALAAQFAYTEQASIGGGSRLFVAAALAFGAVALLQGVSARQSDPRASGFRLSPRVELVLFVAIIALAAFFRFYRFSSFPPGIWFDEGVHGTDAISILEEDHFTVWRSTNFGKATPYLYLLAASVTAFGETAFALRIVPALAGLAAVVAFYFLARRLTGVFPALLATSMLASSRWAVTFSRISWDAAMVPLMATLSVFFLIKALDTRDRRYFLLAGGTLAAGLYTYISFRIVPVIIAMLLVYACCTEWRMIRANVRGLVLYAIAFVLVLAPLAHFTITHTDEVFERTREVNVFREVEDAGSWQPLRHNIRSSIEMMNVKGDPNGRHNIPDAPLLDEVAGALLVLGLAVSAASFWRWRRGGIALWLALALIPGALTIVQDNPSAIRDIGALPPIYLLVAMTFATLYRTLTPLRIGGVTFAVLSAGLVSASIAINYYDFFERQAHDQRVYDGFTPAFQDVGEIVAEHGNEQRYHVSHQFAGEAPVTFLTHDVAFDRYYAGVNLIFPRDDKPHVLIADQRQFSIIPTLRRLYPNLSVEDWIDPFGRRPFTRITLPPADLDALHRLPLNIVASSGETEATFARIDRVWTDADLVDGPVVATWDGYLWSSGAASEISFAVTAPGVVALEIDSQRFESETGSLSTMPLEWPTGEHRIRIEARIERPGAVEFGVETSPDDPHAGADYLYGTTVGAHGMRVLYRESEDFAADAVARGRVPFAVPLPARGSALHIEYQGLFNAPAAGRYGFALDGLTSTLFVDDQIVVDNGGNHSPLRVEGFVELEQGEHLLSLRYSVTDEPAVALEMKPPGQDWASVDGSEFSVPPDDYRPPGLVRVLPDESWGPGAARQVELPGELRAIDAFADGRLVTATGESVAILDRNAIPIARFDGVGTGITDIEALDDGGIAIADAARREITILNGDGTVRARFDDIQGAAGVGASNTHVYAVSPAGGVAYRVALEGGDPDELVIADVRQPADIAITPDGVIYIADFESREILRSSDGMRISSRFPGVTGSGDRLPHLAIYGDLLIASDPVARRLQVFSLDTGRQRGSFAFPNTTEVEPLGLTVAPDGRLYVVDRIGGAIYRFELDRPDAP